MAVNSVHFLDEISKNRFFTIFQKACGPKENQDPLWAQNHFSDKGNTLQVLVALQDVEIDPLKHIQDKKDINLIRSAFEIAFDDSLSSEQIKQPELKAFAKSLENSSVEVRALVLKTLALSIEDEDTKIWNDAKIELTINSRLDVFCHLIDDKVNDIDVLHQTFESTIELIETKLIAKIESKDEAWQKRIQCWESFKERIRTYPQAILFDNIDPDNRKMQYFTLGIRYINCVKATIDSSYLEFVLDSIDSLDDEQSFLKTCLTGWSKRIFQLESIAGIASLPELTLTPLQLSRQIRRQLVNDWILPKIRVDDSQSVHILENFQAAMNEPFLLGYSSEDLGAAQKNIFLFNSDYLEVFSLLEKDHATNLCSMLQEVLRTLKDEDRLVPFLEFLDFYFDKVKSDESFLIDKWEKAREVFDELENWDESNPDAIQELKNIKNCLKEYVEDVSCIDLRTPQEKFFEESVAPLEIFKTLRIPLFFSLERIMDKIEKKIRLLQNRKLLSF